MDEGPPFAEINLAKSPFEARVIVAVLQDAGIPARIDGASLQDEFAISQVLMNSLGVKITVPADRLDDAYRALEDARGTEIAVDTPPVPYAERAPGDWLGFRPSTVILSLLCLVFLALWITARNEVQALTQDVLVDYEYGDGGGVARWKGTDTLASDWRDADRNNVWEVLTSFNRDGQKVATFYDRNQNGIYERFEAFDGAGRRVAESLDADEDGWVEKFVQFYESGPTAVNYDADGDGVFELREVFDEKQTKLFAEEDRGAAGHVRR